MTTAITPLPTPPTRADPDNFADRADAFLAALPAFGAQLNTVGGEVQILGNAAEANAASAYASRLAAELASDAELWDAGTAYATGQAAVSPVDYQAYRRKAPGGTDGTDPSASSDWTLIGEKFATKASPQFTGAISLANDPAQNTTIGASQYMASTPSNDNSAPRLSPIFKNPIAEQATFVGAVSTGVSQPSGYWCSSLGTNQWAGFFALSTGVQIQSGYSNSAGTPGPISFVFKGSSKASIASNGVLYGRGVAGQNGVSGGASSSPVNLYWTGAALQLWVNDVNLGNVTYSSDYRVKKNVETMTADGLSRIALLRPIVYEYQDFESLDFKGDGVTREGFLAHELAEVIPSAVEGEKDAPNQVQSLRLDPLIAVLVKAVQEQQSQIDELRALLEAR